MIQGPETNAHVVGVPDKCPYQTVVTGGYPEMASVQKQFAAVAEML